MKSYTKGLLLNLGIICHIGAFYIDNFIPTIIGVVLISIYVLQLEKEPIK